MIEVRRTREADLYNVVELKNKVWSPWTRFPRQKFESRLKIFPERVF